MKKKLTVSPYSIMYLVTPAIYEKLLLCIDEGDQKLLDNLNKPHDETEDRRPAQIRLDALSSEEIKPIVPLPFNEPQPLKPELQTAAVHNVPNLQQPQQQEVVVPISQSLTPQIEPTLQQQELPITVSIAPTVANNPPLGPSLPHYKANVKH